MQFSDFFDLALVVRRIETGKPEPMTDHVATMDKLARALLLEDPALAQKVLRLVATCSARVLDGLISAATHEAEEGCEDCAEKFRVAGPQLKALLEAEASDRYITSVVNEAHKAMAEAGGDVAKAIENVQTDNKRLQEEARDLTRPGAAKKKEYLN